MEAVEGRLESSVFKNLWCSNVDFEICLLAVQLALEFLQKHLTAIRVRLFDEVFAYRSRQMSLFTETISSLNFMTIRTLY